MDEAQHCKHAKDLTAQASALTRQHSTASLDTALSNLGNSVAEAPGNNIQLHKLEHGALICFAANGVLLCADTPLQTGPALLVESAAPDAARSGQKQLLHFSPAFVFIAYRQVRASVALKTTADFVHGVQRF